MEEKKTRGTQQGILVDEASTRPIGLVLAPSTRILRLIARVQCRYLFFKDN